MEGWCSGGGNWKDGRLEGWKDGAAAGAAAESTPRLPLLLTEYRTLNTDYRASAMASQARTAHGFQPHFRAGTMAPKNRTPRSAGRAVQTLAVRCRSVFRPELPPFFRGRLGLFLGRWRRGSGWCRGRHDVWVLRFDADRGVLRHLFDDDC